MLRSTLRRNGALEGAPAEIRARLDAEWAQTLARNVQLVRETRRVLDALRANGIEALPLKGMALFIGGVHRDLGARPTSDIDILTWPRDRAGVVECLRRAGYCQIPLGGAKHLPPFVRGGFTVEVHECAHWDIRDARAFRVGDMRADAGGAALAATVAHLIHHLFESSTPTRWLTVKTLWDLNEVRVFAASRPALAQAVADEAARAGLAPWLGDLAGALSRLVKCPLPESWIRTSCSERVDRLLETCVTPAPSYERALRVPLALRMLWRSPAEMRRRMLLEQLAPPPSAMGVLYGVEPAWFWPMHLARPAHLALRTVVDVAHLLAGRWRRRRVSRVPSKRDGVGEQRTTSRSEPAALPRD